MTTYKQLGFTLVEVIITTAIGAMIITAISTLFFTIAVNTAKINARKEIREAGTFISQNFDYMVKNALELLPDDNGANCNKTTTTNLANLRLKSIDGGITDFKIIHVDDIDYIASNSTKLTTKEITPADLEFSCIKNPTGETYVHYQFTLNLADLASQSFNGYVLMRNAY